MHVDTYDRIWAHALKRGYQPKGMHLASSPSAPPGQVGFIIRAPLRLNTPSLYFGHVQQGLHVALEHHALASVFIGAEDQLSPRNSSESSRRVIISKASLSSAKFPVRSSISCASSTCASSRSRARYPALCHSVLGNEPQALESLVKHLHGLGHRRFGWLGGNVGLGRHETRLGALESALAAVDLKLNPRYSIKLAAGDRAEGTEAVHTLSAQLDRRDFPTAFICYNSLMAAGAIRAFERAGRTVPRRCEHRERRLLDRRHPPPAPHYRRRLDPEKLGEAAGRLIAGLGAHVADESFTDLMLPAQLFIGDTTGPGAVEPGRLRPAAGPNHFPLGVS